jgi:hypothetical protein
MRPIVATDYEQLIPSSGIIEPRTARTPWFAGQARGGAGVVSDVNGTALVNRIQQDLGWPRDDAPAGTWRAWRLRRGDAVT